MQIPDKEDLVDSLKYCIYMKLSKLKMSEQLCEYIRKSIFIKIINISKTVGNFIRLAQLVKITFTHINIAKYRWILYLIKRWRFISFVRKMTMKKMELMYKDLHVTYLDMAGNVLDEKAPMGLYDRRFLPDIKMNKYIYDFNDPFLVEGSPSYQCLKKKYVFKKLKAEKAKEKKTKTNYIKEIKTVEKIKEKNYNAYYNGNNKNNIYNNNSTTVTNKNKNNYDYTNDITVSNNKNNIYNNNSITFSSNNNNKSFKERKNISNDIYNTDKENMKNINSFVVQNAIKH
jgi:hypothetical protein